MVLPTQNNTFSPKQRMLNAYKGIASDRVPVAPELWYYYPAKLLGVDMIEFERDVKFHLALKNAFEYFACEGWGAAFFSFPNPDIESRTTDVRLDDENFEQRTEIRTPKGVLTSKKIFNVHEPSWGVESLIKDPGRDLDAWELVAFGGKEELLDPTSANQAMEEVSDTYLLEAWLGTPFFDFYAGGRDGGFQTAVLDFMEPELEPVFQKLQQRYIGQLQRHIDAICEKTDFESFCLGCSWSCNSLIGPELWRRWDKPVIKAVADRLHQRNKLLHIHFHGRSLETIDDFAEIGIDCVCPFERPPGGDIDGIDGLYKVAEGLAGKVTMNGNVHTVETLIRGSEDDVQREVDEILEAFSDNPRVIVGTGDQVGRETPEENIRAMIDRVKCTSNE